MLVSSVVASRIGAKRTLLAGLVLIIAFSAAAGASKSIGAIVGLRAGWGLRNALAYIAAHAPSHVIIVSPAAGALGRPSAGGPFGDPSVGAGLVPIATEPDEEIANLPRLVASPEPFPQSGW